MKAPVAPSTAPVAPPNAAKNCDPPFTLDSDGHKKWKPECL